MLALLLMLLELSVEVTAVTMLVDVVSVAHGVPAIISGGGGCGGDVGPLTSSAQGTGEPGGVTGVEYVGRRIVMSFGMGPGFRLLGGRDELSPPPEPKPSEEESERLRPFEDDEVAPTISISASSTIMRLSILKGLPAKVKINYFFWLKT